MVREEERLATHLPFLATVGSTSPYVGLFGTVWGIMNSFRQLATVSQASLATVAPGISEALITTELGLVLAIPALIAHAMLSRRVAGVLARLEKLSVAYVNGLSRRPGSADSKPLPSANAG